LKIIHVSDLIHNDSGNNMKHKIRQKLPMLSGAEAVNKEHVTKILFLPSIIMNTKLYMLKLNGRNW
jgi:hypothetical protein